MAGVIEAVLEGANFPAKVSAHWHKVKGYFSTYANPLYSTSDLRQIRYTTHPTY